LALNEIAYELFKYSHLLSHNQNYKADQNEAEQVALLA